MDMNMFPNIAGNTDVDDIVKHELLAAGINIIESEPTPHAEVKTKYIGELNGFKFRRAWRYWVCEGNMPLEVAKRLYAEHKDLCIRAGGHCENLPPENMSVNPVYLKDLQDYKEKVGLDEFIKSYETAVIDDKTQPRFVQAYHIDTRAGLSVLASFIKNCVMVNTSDESVLGYADFYVKIECEDGTITTSHLSLNFGRPLDGRFMELTLKTCCNLAEQHGYKPINAVFISKDEYKNIAVDSDHHMISYSKNNDEITASYLFDIIDDDSEIEQLKMQFAINWGEYINMSTTTADAAKMKKFSIKHLNKLFTKWAQEYKQSTEYSRMKPIEYFTKMLHELLSEQNDNA